MITLNHKQTHNSSALTQAMLLQHQLNVPVPELLADAEINEYIHPFLARKDVFLSAAAGYDCPLYLVDSAALRARVEKFRAAFAAELTGPFRIYAALKTNSCLQYARIFMDCGLGLDVSGYGELELALSTGCGDIIFSGPGKSDAELRLAVENSTRVRILVDSFGELQRLEAIASDYARSGGGIHQSGYGAFSVRIGVRLNSNPKGLWRKFGIMPDELEAFMLSARLGRHTELEGIQFHTSWNMNPAAQVDFIGLLGETLRRLPDEMLTSLKYIDIGGGYWPETGEWLQCAATDNGALRKLLAPETVDKGKRYRIPAAPIELFADELAKAIEENLYSIKPLDKITICMEPGRWLCQGGMHILMRVLDRKSDDLVITDAGTNTVGWERFEYDFFPVINLSRPALRERICDIHGCLCTPHDIWGYSYWGQDIRQGDVLLIPDQGAYTYSLRQEFIKNLPQIHII